ncbi:MAG: sugar ABC transporter permease [Anaerolineae bacterium]|nr:sugar ABC transporter permease [Anaerolineae bacterium]
MNTTHGWKKWSVIILLLIPTLTGITFVNLIPMFYNFRLSFTNADRLSHNGRDAAHAWQDVGLQNYQTLIAELVTPAAVASFAKLIIVLLPLVVVNIFARRMTRNKLVPPDTRMVWLGGVAATIILWLVLNGGDALNVLTQNSFFVVLLRSTLYVIFCMPFFLLVGLVLALILNNPDIRFKSFWRTLLIIPWAVPTFITALIWQFFFRDAGTINLVFQSLNIQDPKSPIHWLSNPQLAFFAIVLVNIWMSYPFFMTIILGALQSIPADMYEAAEVDGATWWISLTRITIPMLRPAVLPAVVLSSITTFQMFNTVYLITQGGPVSGVGKPGATDLVMTYAYSQTFKSGNYGYIGAFAVIIFVILLAATLLSLRVTNVTRGAYE